MIPGNARSSEVKRVADIKTIAPRSGAGFTLDKGQILTVIDPEGRQVSDLLAYNRADVRESFNSYSGYAAAQRSGCRAAASTGRRGTSRSTC